MNFVATAVEDVVEGVGLIEAIGPTPMHRRGEKNNLRKHQATHEDDALQADSFTHEAQDDGTDGDESDATYFHQADGFF